MARRHLSLLIAGVISASLLAWWVLKPDPLATIQGRPINDWLRESAFNHGTEEKPRANEVLYEAGPQIVPELSRLLRQADFLSSVAAKLPDALVPPAIRARFDNQLVMKAKAAWVISVIAYRNPTAAENRSAIPALTLSLGSRNAQLRYVAAQALAAIGPAASNAVPMLVLKTTDQNSSVRLCAVDALGRIGFASDDTIKALQEALFDGSRDVRLVATNALERLQQAQQ
jgi:hypothetical protein